ncbi:hypothetical protein [Accumulibacter sp.]|uniref:hypothetical protein n=1 Tax=Accumulibacter sp. TaxID=2053492 RepID=UPI0028C4C094|nr:hypothetical protein [Accumulibacter sp.]
MANDADDDYASARTGRAAARWDGASYGTDASANGGILALRRHSGANTQTKQYGCGDGSEREALIRLKGLPLPQKGCFHPLPFNTSE